MSVNELDIRSDCLRRMTPFSLNPSLPAPSLHDSFWPNPAGHVPSTGRPLRPKAATEWITAAGADLPLKWWFDKKRDPPRVAEPHPPGPSPSVGQTPTSPAALLTSPAARGIHSGYPRFGA